MTENATMLRAFIAVNLPAEVRTPLETMLRRLKFPLAQAGITWANPAQIHLTLKFLGDISADSVGELTAAIRRGVAGVGPFTLHSAGLGMFPDDRKPRVVWAGVRGELPVLARLQEQIERETQAWRAAEHREFRPHLTLGRVRHIRPAQAQILGAKVAEFRAADFGEWRVGQVDLMQSHLSATGVTHTRLAEFPLDGCD